ncbi:MAG TPA: DUF1850 domain-containing protein [Spirochaetota bacterium]|nr:DUF1850 domain-containing protein [Spirochaetota bacterium]HPJ42710.1 DUF1850 domain-containing protein [Spirochaetota bacterium]
MAGRTCTASHATFVKILAVSVFLFALLLFPVFKGITITDYKTGKLLYFNSADTGDRFSVRYIHSVNKSPVEDFFRIDDDTIIIERSVFTAFGAGVPASPDDGGILNVYNDRIEVTEINRRIDDFLLFIGVTAEHRFKIDQDEFLLRDISSVQRSLRIVVKRISLLDIIKLRYY